MTTIAIVDESTAGGRSAWNLDFWDETVSLRELIRQRIYQEVTEYNATKTGYFRSTEEGWTSLIHYGQD